MTCIVTLADGGVVWMGSDSSATNGQDDKEILKNPKTFAKRDRGGTLWLIGYAGDIRFGQLVEHTLILPSVTAAHKENLIKFLVSDFINDLRNCLRGGGAMSDGQKGRKEKSSGSLIVGINGEIFTIDDHFQILAPINPFTSIGSGSSTAFGALGATKGLLPPDERILIALELAQEYSASVSDPFLIMNSKEAEESVRYVRSRRKRKR